LAEVTAVGVLLNKQPDREAVAVAVADTFIPKVAAQDIQDRDTKAVQAYGKVKDKVVVAVARLSVPSCMNLA
jgi:hypothetical protein